MNHIQGVRYMQSLVELSVVRLIWSESLIDGFSGTVILCLHQGFHKILENQFIGFWRKL
jgi:hypothetical protein